jgi:hypothetical protein
MGIDAVISWPKQFYTKHKLSEILEPAEKNPCGPAQLGTRACHPLYSHH